MYQNGKSNRVSMPLGEIVKAIDWAHAITHCAHIPTVPAKNSVYAISTTHTHTVICLVYFVLN